MCDRYLPRVYGQRIYDERVTQWNGYAFPTARGLGNCRAILKSLEPILDCVAPVKVLAIAPPITTWRQRRRITGSAIDQEINKAVLESLFRVKRERLARIVVRLRAGYGPRLGQQAIAVQQDNRPTADCVRPKLEQLDKGENPKCTLKDSLGRHE